MSSQPGSETQFDREGQERTTEPEPAADGGEADGTAAVAVTTTSTPGTMRPRNSQPGSEPRRGLDDQEWNVKPEPTADGGEARGESDNTAIKKKRVSLRNWGPISSLIPLVLRWEDDESGAWTRITEPEDVYGTTERRHHLAREHTPSSLPLLSKSGNQRSGDTKSPDDVRALLYAETLAAWRQLTDVRFRLMSMLPAISIVAFIPLFLLATGDGLLAPAAGVVLAVLGLCLTHGLHIYEERNDALYGHMISRARRIEAELGVETGLMLGRPAKLNKRISHGRGMNWVFGSVKVAWLVAILVLAFALGDNFVADDAVGTVTREEYDSLEFLDDRGEVADALGGMGIVEFRDASDGRLVEVVSYPGQSGGSAVLTFVGGSLRDMAEFDLD